MTISFESFLNVDLRVGTVIKIEQFTRAIQPAYKVWVDFGDEVGIKKTSAQITVHYTPEMLVGKQVIGCINLGEKNIAGFISEFLLIGVPDATLDTVLITTMSPVPNGKKLC